MIKEYYTVQQVAAIVGLHEKTVQRYIREGRIKALKIGKSWRVTKKDLDDFTLMSKEQTAHKESNTQRIKSNNRMMVSAVMDIDDCDKEEAIRISNSLSAVMNSRNFDFHRCTFHTQYLEQEDKLRLMLWGHPQFIEHIMASVTVLIH